MTEKIVQSSAELKKKHISEPWAWNQIMVSYLSISGRNPSFKMPMELISIHLEGISGENESIDSIKKRFLAKLKETHLKNNQLDLHGLDHLSAKLLLQETFNNLTRIAFGKSGHSKSACINKMKDLVSDFVKNNSLAVSWEPGALTIKKDDVIQKPTQGFFNTKDTPDVSTNYTSGTRPKR